MLQVIVRLFVAFSTVLGLRSDVLPDVRDKELVLSLAELASNAYHYPEERNTTGWRNSTKLWKYEYSYGWDIDGPRGHVFSHDDPPVITVAVKGTSLNSKKDKESANLICSCNCCYANCTRECDKDRLLESLPNMYLSLLLLEYDTLLREYPNHNIWFTGHSMGAVIAALAGVRTCHPAVGFSAPGEQLFSNRIGLKHKCASELPPIYHIGYYRDPIFAGNCGWLCMVAGYRMDSKCHHGMECIYRESTGEDEDRLLYQTDVRDNAHGTSLGLGSGLIYTHTVNFLIDRVISPNAEVPICVSNPNCTEICNKDESL